MSRLGMRRGGCNRGMALVLVLAAVCSGYLIAGSARTLAHFGLRPSLWR